MDAVAVQVGYSEKGRLELAGRLFAGACGSWVVQECSKPVGLQVVYGFRRAEPKEVHD